MVLRGRGMFSQTDWPDIVGRDPQVGKKSLQPLGKVLEPLTPSYNREEAGRWGGGWGGGSIATLPPQGKKKSTCRAHFGSSSGTPQEQTPEILS